MSDFNLTKSITAELPGDKELTGLSRTIVIGIGGTGKEVITRVRKSVIEEFDSLEAAPVIAFLQVDTDAAPAAWRPGGAQKAATEFKESEIVHVTVSRNDFGGELRRHPHLAEWLDPLVEKYEVADGAKQIRQLGRLALFMNHERIKSAFGKALDRVRDNDAPNELRKRGVLVQNIGLNVYIVGSFSGGTGSGTMMEIAYMVRKQLEASNIKAGKVFGYIVLPEVYAIDGKVEAKANAFAAFKELDYFNSGHSLEVQYTPNENTRTTLRGRPFSSCYLINNTNENGALLKVPQLYDMVSQHIFMDFLPGGIGQLNRSIRDNLTAKCDTQDAEGCNQNYMAFGVSRIFFPYERVIDGCTHIFALNHLKRWLQPYERQTESGRIKMDNIWGQFIYENPLWRYEGMLDRLTTGQDNQPYMSEIRAFIEELPYRAEHETEQKYIGDFLRSQLNDFEKRNFSNDSPHPQEWNGYPRKMHQGVDRVLREYEKLLREHIQRKVELDLGKGDGGLTYTIEFLEHLRKSLDDYHEVFVKKEKELSENHALHHEHVAEAIAKVHDYATDFMIGIAGGRKEAMRKGMSRFTEVAQEYYQSALNLAALHGQVALHMLEALRKKTSDLLATLRSFSDLLRAIQTKLVDRENEVRTGSSLEGEIFTGSDLDHYYRRYVPFEQEGAKIEALHRGICAHFRVNNFLELIELPRDASFQTELMNALVTQAEQPFVDLKSVSIAERFFTRFPNTQEQEDIITKAFDAAAPYVQLVGKPGIDLKDPSKFSVAIGLRGGASNPPDEQFGELLKIIRRATKTDESYIKDLSDREKHQIVIIRERAAFPLRALLQMDDYQKLYSQFRSVTGNPPLHLTRDDARFDVNPGIIPPDKRELEAARKFFVAGVRFGIFKLEHDTVLYEWGDGRTSILDHKILGSLRYPDKAVRKLIQETEVRRRIEEQTERIVREARSRPAVHYLLSLSLESYYREMGNLAREEFKRNRPDAEMGSEGFRKEASFAYAESAATLLSEYHLGSKLALEDLQRHNLPVPGAEAPLPKFPIDKWLESIKALESPVLKQAPSGPAKTVAVSASTKTSEGSVCSACQAINPASGKFCVGCGTALGLRCIHCNIAIATEARFCPECGKPQKVEATRPTHCSRCREPLPASGKFCPGCGHTVEGT